MSTDTTLRAPEGDDVSLYKAWRAKLHPSVTNIDPFYAFKAGIAAAKAEQSNTSVPRVDGNTCEYKPYCAYCDEDRDEPCSAPSCGVAGDFAATVAERAAAPASVPEGYRLVPIEPTDAMMDAAEECSNDWPRTTWAKAYSAMISAAPEVAQPAAQGEHDSLSLQQVADRISGRGVMSPVEFRKFLNGDGVEMYPHRIAALVNLCATPAPTAGDPPEPEVWDPTRPGPYRGIHDPQYSGRSASRDADAASVPEGYVLARAEIYTLRRLIECAEKLDARPRPMCRDCADEDGTCPNSGLECDMRKLFADAKSLHNKLAAPC